MGCDISSAESFISHWLKHHRLGLRCSLLYYGCKGHFELASASYCHPHHSAVDKSNLSASTQGEWKLRGAALSSGSAAQEPQQLGSNACNKVQQAS